MLRVPATQAEKEGLSYAEPQPATLPEPPPSKGGPAYLPEVSAPPEALITKDSVDSTLWYKISPDLHPMQVKLPLKRTGKIR